MILWIQTSEKHLHVRPCIVNNTHVEHYSFVQRWPTKRRELYFQNSWLEGCNTLVLNNVMKSIEFEQDSFVKSNPMAQLVGPR